MEKFTIMSTTSKESVLILIIMEDTHGDPIRKDSDIRPES